jgi:hypothetical protein
MLPIWKLVPTLIAAALVLSLTACETSYAKRETYGPYGYTDKKIGDDEFSVVANGNKFTSQQRVADMALLRAAHLTLEQGRTHFVIMKQETQSVSVRRTMTVPFPIGAGGMPVWLPVGEHDEAEPRTYLLIRLVPKDTAPPADAIDAAAVVADLGKELGGN